jgi:uncharacterized membrane protein YqiK
MSDDMKKLLNILGIVFIIFGIVLAIMFVVFYFIASRGVIL